MAKHLLSDVICRKALPRTGPDGTPRLRVLNDGDGLRLIVQKDGRKKWVCRTTLAGRERATGYGFSFRALAERDCGGAAMSGELEELYARLAKLETEHAELCKASAETKQRYTSLLQMMKELTANAVEASTRAAASAEKSLLASQQAAFAAKEAAIVGAIQVADAALTAAKAAADAAGEAAIASTEAWTAALVAAGHNANMELLAMSSKASQSSRDATAFAKEALRVFVDAFEVVKRAAASPS